MDDLQAEILRDIAAFIEDKTGRPAITLDFHDTTDNFIITLEITIPAQKGDVHE